jgi:ubiquinone biosynthesis protein Coq4
MSAEIVRAGRDHYLAENSLSTDSYTARRFPIYVGSRAIYLPNPGYLPWHDLHHVVTGYKTGLVGEAEISAYELRSGCRSPFIIILCVGAMLIALFVAPRRVMRAWQSARGTRNLYRQDVPYDSLLEMKVEELRRMLGIPREGFRR